MFFLQLCTGWTCRVVRVLPHTKVCKYSFYKTLLMMDRWGPKHVELKLRCWLRLIHWDHILYLVGLYILASIAIGLPVFCNTTLRQWVIEFCFKEGIFRFLLFETFFDDVSTLEDEDITLPWSVGIRLTFEGSLYPRRIESSATPKWKPKNWHS